MECLYETDEGFSRGTLGDVLFPVKACAGTSPTGTLSSAKHVYHLIIDMIMSSSITGCVESHDRRRAWSVDVCLPLPCLWPTTVTLRMAAHMASQDWSEPVFGGRGCCHVMSAPSQTDVVDETGLASVHLPTGLFICTIHLLCLVSKYWRGRERRGERRREE